MDPIVEKAYAKINLCLDVLRRREDGYHEVKMIMQTIGLYDTLTLKKREDEQIVLEIQGHPELSAGSDNLIVKAAKALLLDAGRTDGVSICLEKRIPIAAGMAGGSTDAAATLRGINQLLELGYSPEELKKIGVRLGADIPYCIEGGTRLSEGIGEILTPVPEPKQMTLVVVKPNLMVSTKYVYENLHANELKEHPDVNGMAEALKAGDMAGVVKRLGNVLENVTCAEYPIIPHYKDVMKDEGALGALMSGSGPTVFGIFEDDEAARRTADRILAEGETKEVFVTGFAIGELYEK